MIVNPNLPEDPDEPNPRLMKRASYLSEREENFWYGLMFGTLILTLVALIILWAANP
jgi:tetrahydromethanopterin S-methyltransferase subunit B